MVLTCHRVNILRLLRKVIQLARFPIQDGCSTRVAILNSILLHSNDKGTIFLYMYKFSLMECNFLNYIGLIFLTLQTNKQPKMLQDCLPARKKSPLVTKFKTDFSVCLTPFSSQVRHTVRILYNKVRVEHMFVSRLTNSFISPL